MSAGRSLVGAVRRELAERADPERAPRMQAYMKSELPFRGVTQPVLWLEHVHVPREKS